MSVNDIEITLIWPQADIPQILDIWGHPNLLIQYGAQLRYGGKVYEVLSYEPQPAKLDGYIMTRFTAKIINQA